jgi:glycosyltransferase involved in cell wall biosynthesis
MVGTTHVLLGLRVRGEGSAMVRGLAEHTAQHEGLAVPLLGRSRHLLLTNVYPSEQRLYRNAFVHRRVVGYREAGLDVDVFAMSESQASYEFDNVDVLSGDASVLDKILKANGYESILVHFLDPEMWRVISRHRHHCRVLVWVHGAEIQPWHRRAFNYGSEQERQEAVRASDSRMQFWREVLGCRHPNLHFIFVSRYFAEEVMTDVGVRLHESQYSIIHNFIDTNLFQYHEKPADQRKKVLSIRPYASRKYANDLSVEAVLALSKESYFNDLEFRFIGDGELFDETLAPLRGFPNVRIERRFVEQHEIASLHRNYGIFLCPTRMDSQGVSKDEAMSSGLVPVTNAITAIPEFVDAESGMLAGEEDAEGLAAGIDKLVNDPAMFQRLSRNAAQRVRVQCGEAATLARERDLIARRV